MSSPPPPAARTISAADYRAAIARAIKKNLITSDNVSYQKYDYSRDILAFVHDILHADLAPYQAEILSDLQTYKRIAVRGPHGLGKTALSAFVVAWSITAFDEDVKTVTTAGAWRQLIRFTWPEIRKWCSLANWQKMNLEIRRGKELLDLSLSIGNKQAFAVASDNPALIEGAHATNLFYVFDEAKAIPNGTWDAAEGAFSGGGADTGRAAYALAISTPGAPSGRFYDIHSRRAGYEDWHVRHVTLEEAIAAGRISREWADQRRKQWGESSAIYQNRVLGEFADSGEDSVIPLRWIELAIERWHACGGKGTGDLSYGVDPAYKGDDSTGIARLVGNVLESIDAYNGNDTMETTGRVAALTDKTTPIAVDVIGIGAGVYDRLLELGYQAIAVNVSHRTDLTDSTGKIGFPNLRSALWWLTREALDPNGETCLALPPDDGLIGDLTAPNWRYTSAGQIQVESKPDMRVRLGRSPDKADALALALFTKVAARPWIMGMQES